MSGRSFLSILTSMALSFGFGSLNANAQTTGICRQVSEIIEHLAIYVVDTFTKKIKKDGISVSSTRVAVFRVGNLILSVT